MDLRSARTTLQERVTRLENIVIDVESDRYEKAEAQSALPNAREELKTATDLVRRAERALDVRDKQRLEVLISNPYISARMNALAAKLKLRERLRARKFEYARIERPFRNQSNGMLYVPLLINIAKVSNVIDKKLHTHTESAMKKRDPTIQSYARTYNRLCDQMAALKRQRKAPAGATVPSKIAMDKLFVLDVDDDIWQDIGLNDDEPESAGMPPLWLSNEGVREGIRAMLERDRCIEEEVRLHNERLAMQQWFAEEWEVISDALLVEKSVLFPSVHHLQTT